MGNQYPQLEINTEKLRTNAGAILRLCKGAGIEVAGVVKAANGDPVCARIIAGAGCGSIAVSRMDQLIRLKKEDFDAPLMLIRIPMMSEVSALVRNASMSLNSDIDVIRAINEEAEKACVRHGIILMIDLGDLREGLWSKDEYVPVACEIENELAHLDLLGVGVNLGCYGSILPTREKMDDLVGAAEKIESAIGRRIDIISGGASTSIPLISKGEMPERINHLRVGEAILINKDNEDLYGLKLQDMFRDVFTLKAEVVEVRVKPSHPVGEIGFDAFRCKPEYVDRGERKRAIVAVGKMDYGYLDQIAPRVAGIEVLGAASDHTILDIEDSANEIKVGDIIDFDLNYVAVSFLASASGLAKVYTE